MLRRNKEFSIVINFLLRYLVSGTTLGRKGDSITTYITNR
jgi:hypothetical protein